MKNGLEKFRDTTRNWFSSTIGSPTPVQREAWPAIRQGKHTLVSAPTGTGKTLSAFLVFIDQMMEEAERGTLKEETRLIYISPLKSLAGDIRENLKRPLSGIYEEENAKRAVLYFKENQRIPEITMAIRTGDTSQKERRNMVKHPPHILITTPESLYLLLSSKSGQKILSTAQAIILDELHALIDTKRGAHLMLSVARLDELCKRPLQRIGLSATMDPLDTAARYLTPDEAYIAAPEILKNIKIEITSPFAESGMRRRKDPVWEDLSKLVYSYCMDKRSVIAFVEGRRYAEKLAYYVNELAGDGFARTHHGSLSKEQRLLVEESLRNGSLRLLCATSSMELGIDVGDIDQVLQIGCPRTISGTMQRLGRAGHNPGRTSVMYMFPRTAPESLYCGLTAEVARRGGVEYAHPPRLCLDVLAQHLVSMAVGEGYAVSDVLRIIKRAYPFRDITEEDVKAVLCMLAGDYEHQREIPVRPRLLYDRINERVKGDAYSRMLAISAGGTIPDKGMYAVKTEEGVSLGELDEEFIYESRIGEKFLLGTFAWQIVGMNKDTVIVKQASVTGAKLPFWKGETKGRPLKTSLEFGRIFHRLGEAYEEGSLKEELKKLGLDDSACSRVEEFIGRQIKATKVLPDNRTILVEHFKDQNGSWQIMVHSMFGRQVNAPLSILVQQEAARILEAAIGCVDEEDGFLLYPYDGRRLPEGLLERVSPRLVRPVLEAILPDTSVFNMTFRYNAARALMMGVKKNGRQPLWLQRMRSVDMMESVIRFPEHPLIRETRKECLEELWDIEGVEYVVNGIQAGEIRIYEFSSDTPSPLSLPLQWQAEAAVMYDYAPSARGITAAVEEDLRQLSMIAPGREELNKAAQREKLPKDEEELHTLLMIEGDLRAGELTVPIEWLESLAAQGRACYQEPGLWIAAEHEEEYGRAMEGEDMEAGLHILRRMLRYRGAMTEEQIESRYFWNGRRVKKLLSVLCGLEENPEILSGKKEQVVELEGFYYHADVYNRARRETVKNLREEIRTVPAERYQALLAGRLQITAPQQEQLNYALTMLCGQAFSPVLWEQVLFPARVRGYREQLLDSMLSQGDYFWRMTPEKELAFERYEDLDWDADMSGRLSELTGEARVLYEALLKRGASFMKPLASLTEGASPEDTLIKMAEQGILGADSFMPVRRWVNREKEKKATVRQRVNARVKALHTGRWDISRPVKELTLEDKLSRSFERMVILSKETAGFQGIPWNQALEILRVWEYTGRVRRGYFINGLSGAQFIRNEDFAATMAALESVREGIIWLSAADPAQVWGKVFPHMPGRSFLNVPQTAVALRGGRPAAVIERQGKVLRVFEGEEEAVLEVMKQFVHDFKEKKLFSQVKRLMIKEYPAEWKECLESAGFQREMMDYVLYR